MNSGLYAAPGRRALASARRPGAAYNPLFIYGGVGLGKTHLLQAMGNTLLDRGTLRVRYVTSEKFMHELITAIQTRTQHTFRERYRSVDVLIVDDVQFLVGKEKTQDELFHTFNELYGSEKQLIFSSDRPPKAIATLEERLRSRFEGGMVADISTPDLETRIAILKAKCALRSLRVPEDVLSFIAAQVSSNIRELEGCLNRVLAYFELRGGVLTLERTKEILVNVLAKPKRTIIHTERLLQAVSTYYHVQVDDLTGKSRRKEVVLPRQVAMFLLRAENGFSFPAIGSIFGGRDHTTAMHACGKIGDIIDRDEMLRQNILAIRQKLYVSAEVV
jgi:chromosomal replication initiator protein